MNLGLRAALGGTFAVGIAMTCMKKIANSYDNNYIGLIWQYIFVSVSALLYVYVFSVIQGVPMFPNLDITAWGVLMLVGIVGFLGIALLFKGFNYISGGICLIIANASVFLMYFANLYLFDSSEYLSWIKVILAVVFFIIIAGFLYTQSDQTDNTNAFNSKMIYPIGTAFCWTIFFVGNTWFVKNEIMTPVQSVFATESIILIIAILRYLISYPHQLAQITKQFKTSHIGILVLLGIANVGANFLLYYGYINNPANVVNFIKLFSIIVTAIFCWLFLGDKLTSKQIKLMSAAFVVLIGFVLL